MFSGVPFNCETGFPCMVVPCHLSSLFSHDSPPCHGQASHSGLRSFLKLAALPMLGLYMFHPCCPTCHECPFPLSHLPLHLAKFYPSFRSQPPRPVLTACIESCNTPYHMLTYRHLNVYLQSFIHVCL